MFEHLGVVGVDREQGVKVAGIVGVELALDDGFGVGGCHRGSGGGNFAGFMVGRPSAAFNSSTVP